MRLTNAASIHQTPYQDALASIRSPLTLIVLDRPSDRPIWLVPSIALALLESMK